MLHEWSIIMIDITWMNHHAAFRISNGASVLYIDPWKVPSVPHDADLVFVSHSHHDHCSPEDIAKVAKAGTVILAPAETVKLLKSASAVDVGQELTVGEITVQTVAAYNIGKQFHPRGHNWCGAVFTIEGKRIYYAGDTDLVDEMGRLGAVDVALLPIGGTYTLDAATAATACEKIGCSMAIPYHWGDVVGSAADAKSFAELAKCKVQILQPGHSVRL